LTAIAGGKYTTFRVMAKDAVDAAARDLGGTIPRSTTDRVQLLGAGATAFDRPGGIDRPQLARLIFRHGACAEEVLALASSDPSLTAPIPGAERYLAAEAVHACSHQGAFGLDDILSRRMRVSIEVPDRGRAAAAAVAPLVAPTLGWSDERVAQEVARYRRLRDAEAAAETTTDDAGAAARYRAVMEGEI